MSWLNLPSLNHTLSDSQKFQFDNEIRKQQIKTSQQFTIITLLLSLLFLVSDAHFLGDHFNHIATIRISVVATCVIAALFIQHMSLNMAYMVLSISVLAYNTVVVYMGILAANNGLDTYQQGTVLIIIYCCTLFQAPVMLTAFITTVCWLSYVFSITQYSTASVSVIFNNTIVFFIASCLGLLSVAHRERYLLGYFLSSQRLKEQELQSKEQAFKDALTELPNRLSIIQKLESYDLAIPKNTLVMMGDVDNFKKLNDQYGHKHGDLALKLIAQALRDTLKSYNSFVSRYGGEEFLIILENIDSEETQAIGDLLVAAIAQVKHPDLPSMSISIGGYLTHGNETSINECIERADQTLLKAKAEGKNRFLLNRREYSK